MALAGSPSPMINSAHEFVVGVGKARWTEDSTSCCGAILKVTPLSLEPVKRRQAIARA